MNDTKLDEIIRQNNVLGGMNATIIKQNEEILGNQELLGDTPIEPAPEEAWIHKDNGTRRRNPDYPGWYADLWDFSKIAQIGSVDIDGIPQIQGKIDGNNVIEYGKYSYHIMLMPNKDWALYHRASGNSISRILALKQGKYVVQKVARLSKGLTYVEGELDGDEIMVLQVSDRPDCGTVYTND